MFSNKDLKVKLVYMGFGGMIAIIGMLFGIGMVASVTAQRDKFGDIECTRLRVVDADGNARVTILPSGVGVVGGMKPTLFDDGVWIGSDGVVINDKDNTYLSTAQLINTKHGGALVVRGSGKGLSMASLSINPYGGIVTAYGKDGSRMWLGINEDGGGVSAYGADGESSARLGISEHGGYVSTKDKFGNTKVLD